MDSDQESSSTSMNSPIKQQAQEEVSNPTSFEISEPTEDSSEDSNFVNRALPNDEVQGYNVYGQPIELPRAPAPGQKLQEYLELQQNPDLLFTRLRDPNTGQMRNLSSDDIEKLNNLIRYNKTFSPIDLEERPELKFIDETFHTSVYLNNLPTKTQFCRKQEIRRTAYFARLIAQGKLDVNDIDGYKKKLREKLEKEKQISDIWETLEKPIQYQSEIMAEHQLLRMTPAPKQKYPETQDSYNPPIEYLKENQQKFKNLRSMIPDQSKMLKERYERQLDLVESVRTRNRDNLNQSSEQFLREHLQSVAKLKLKPYPVFCDFVIRANIGRVNSVDISPNNKFIAAGGKDGILRIFELQSGKLLKQIVLTQHKTQSDTIDKYYSREIFCVKFSPNNKVCICAAAVGNQIVFVNLNMSFGCNLQETKLATKNLLNVDLTKARPCRGWRWECLQGTVSNEADELQITNQQLDQNELNDDNVDDPRFDKIKYQLNHQGGSDNVTVFTQLNNDIMLRIHSPNVINQLDFHPSGDYLISLSNIAQRKTNLTIHRMSKCQSTSLFNKALPLQAAIFNQKYPSLIVFEQTSGFSFDLKSLQKQGELQPQVRQVQKCAYNQQSGDLVVCGSGGAVALFKYAQGPCAESRNQYSHIQTSCIAARFNLVAVGGEDGDIQILRICENQLVSCNALKGHGVKNQVGVRGVCWGANGELVSCAGDGTIRIWR